MSDKEYAEFLQKIDAGFKAGAALALDEHRRMGRSVVIWENGKMVTLTGDEIPAAEPSKAGLPLR